MHLKAKMMCLDMSRVSQVLLALKRGGERKEEQREKEEERERERERG